MIKNHESVSIEMERALSKLLSQGKYDTLELNYHPEVECYLRESDKSHFVKMATKEKCDLEFATKDTLHLNDFEIFSLPDREKIEY